MRSPLNIPITNLLQSLKLKGFIATGGAIVMSPVVLVPAAVLAVGAIGLTGKAIYDLKKSEAEAAANTAANTWCQANLQRCFSDVPGYWRFNTWNRSLGRYYPTFGAPNSDFSLNISTSRFDMFIHDPG